MRMHRRAGPGACLAGARPSGASRAAGAALGAAATAAGSKRSRLCGKALLFPAPSLPARRPASMPPWWPRTLGPGVDGICSTDRVDGISFTVHPKVPGTVRYVTHGRDLNQESLHSIGKTR